MSDELDQMMLHGGVEVAGVDSKGNILYSLVGNLEEDILPKIYETHVDRVHQEMMHFWELGFIEFMDMDRAAPSARLTPKIFDRASINALSESDQETLNRLIYIFRRKG